MGASSRSGGASLHASRGGHRTALLPTAWPKQIERLAHHALRGELREKAVHYLRQAGAQGDGAVGATAEARVWLEQALGVLEALPESQSTLEQAFDIRLDLRSVLHQLGEPRRGLERLREAETFAERLHDDRRRGRVCAFMTPAHGHLGELDEALASGTRALEIAGVLGDLPLRILSTSLLEQAYYYRGEYERVVELAHRQPRGVARRPALRVFRKLCAGICLRSLVAGPEPRRARVGSRKRPMMQPS